MVTDHLDLWSNALEHRSLFKRVKVNVAPDRRFPMTIHTHGLVARCTQKTGIAIALNLHPRTRLPYAVIPLKEGMAGRAGQISDMNLLPPVVKQLDVPRSLAAGGEDVVNQFA